MSNLSDFLGGGGGGGTPVNGRAILDLGGQVQYTDSEGKVWLKTGNVLTSGLENYPDATVKTRPLLSSLTYDGVSANITSGEGNNSFLFKPDGTKVYALQDNTDTLYQYNVSTPWDLSTLSSSWEASKNIGAAENSPTSFTFSDDGKVIYVSGANGYSTGFILLNTPWDISSSVLSSSFGGSMAYSHDGFSNSTTPQGFLYARAMKSLGPYIYFPAYTGTLLQLKRPASRMAAGSQMCEVARFPFPSSVEGFEITNSGDRMFIMDGGIINELDLDAGDITTITSTYVTQNPEEFGNAPLYLKPDMTKLYAKPTFPGNTIYQYSLTTEDYIGVPAENRSNEYLRIK